MSEILPIALRPRRLSELVGQEKLAAAIRQQMKTRPPSAFLLHGATGTGKTSLARILALSFQCKCEGSKFGEPCKNCWERWPEYCIHEINASDTSGVEEIGRVAEMARYRATPPSRRRVVILDEAQLLTTNSQNLLLESFEKTSAGGTVWIVCTTAPNKILATLRRRCMTYQLHGLSFTDREQLLKTAAARIGLKHPLEKLTEAAASNQLSSPALLLMALEKYAAGFSAEEAVSNNEGTAISTLAVCKAVSSGDWNKTRAAIQNLAPEDVRWVRASVSGWLCGILKRESHDSRREVLSRAIRLLTEIAPLEETLLTHWLWARLSDVCRLLRGVA